MDLEFDTSRSQEPARNAEPARGVRSAVTRGWRRTAPFLWRLTARVALGVGLVLLWQAAASFRLADPTVTSSPGDVFAFLNDALRDPLFWSSLRVTMEAVFIAFVLASAVGIAIGISLALLPTVEWLVAPYLDALNAMPRIALAPVFVVAFGLTTSAKVALAFSVVVFILITSARAGVRSVDPDILRLATVLGARRRELFTQVLLPVATPSIFGGLRLGLIYSLLGVVTSELIAARDGIGQLIQQYAGVFRTDALYGILIVLATVAMLLNLGMGVLERYVLRWQPPPAK